MGHEERKTLIQPLAVPSDFCGKPQPLASSLPVSPTPIPKSPRDTPTANSPPDARMHAAWSPQQCKGGAHSQRSNEVTSQVHLRSLRTASRPSGEILSLVQTHSKMSRDTPLNEALQPKGPALPAPTPQNPPLYPALPEGKGYDTRSPQAGGLERARKGSGGLRKVS